MKVSDLKFMLGLSAETTPVIIELNGEYYNIIGVKPMVDLKSGYPKLYCKIECDPQKLSM